MLTKDLIDAYHNTNYYFGNSQLRINELSSEAQAILKPFSPFGGLFITAWNPMGEVLDLSNNQVANKDLKSELEEKGLIIIEGYGESLDKRWREDSFFVYPVDQETSIKLCCDYRQNAVVYITSEGIPLLLLNEKFSKQM